MPDSTNMAAWVAIILSGLAIIKQVVDFFQKYSKERTQIEEALDKAPIVKQSLELGNIGDAVTHLNAIIVSQAKHIDSQDVKILHLQNRNAALEAEEDARERRIVELETLVRRLTRELREAKGGNFHEPDHI